MKEGRKGGTEGRKGGREEGKERRREGTERNDGWKEGTEGQSRKACRNKEWEERTEGRETRTAVNAPHLPSINARKATDVDNSAFRLAEQMGEPFLDFHDSEDVDFEHPAGFLHVNEFHRKAL
jgi:hypothetical protein